ncbi:succinyl-diaminopimelate desuccinylase [Zymomonas mobilis]|uniref:Succinyl-diaminopimelate desuccinylase n=1 Tax=Zymomonas mobilis subsp. pomaceae (strain ATCC 29192 / DSM 22645 / JCM 10191 / CCUG 17912 / NBRC 13757 / NCIMB 11200 / NRRL B-4491 / Barker I) TaxID=579138 RepID=F8EVN4_ZYMMT|nr:succinyl-diaminopimelate desuccinylase [Zymomonas mobilis]AEI38371.1 succinyl-diaminopimelate desuccinylase [Zymomonas mobilis subsp. pomaceae ATCC 29192]MDX5948060.1 succinyl-diaminopimelate desuccinylase [Zymomonas mobilis subsp. pomaceae]GEB89390.1 succinyl-diaminopimelate desuccinylase [Zymomonas mobilis subsp. pomaceae]
MTAAPDAVELAARLIACKSVTPTDDGAMSVMGDALKAAGFKVHLLTQGQAPDGPVTNLIAFRGEGHPHLAFAGHSDVVPAGQGWSSDPFTPTLKDGYLVGRGAVDMKSSVAAFIAAAARYRHHKGTLSFLITGDEEGPATYGTPAIIAWLLEHDIKLDYCVVGEPTSIDTLGDTIKNGRRGSVNMWIEVPGIQGHVAYPDRAKNPIPILARIIEDLENWIIDEGDQWFQPSNLEITAIECDNKATNVIPSIAKAQLNIRFNALQKGAQLIETVRNRVNAIAPDARLKATISGEAFVTEEGVLTKKVSAAVAKNTGITPTLSTSGGTSDARFLTHICPVIEFGLVNATMHKVDEQAAVADIQQLSRIDEDIIKAFLG